MNETQTSERRNSRREWRSQPIWWKDPKDTEFHQGWLLERSVDGVAFLARGGKAPLPGSRIVASTSDPRDPEGREQKALVTRLNHVHADLYLVATRLVNARRHKQEPALSGI